VPEPLDDALAQVRALLLDPDRLLRAVAAGRRRSAVPAWRRVELRPVELKSGPHLQVTAYDDRQAHTRNEPYDPEGAGGLAAAVDLLLAEPFGNWHVETTEGTVQLRVTKRGEAQVHRSAPASRAGDDAVGAIDAVDRSHDRSKPRLLDPALPFWQVLGITDAQGRVKPSRQDKYRQVEELLRALDPVVGSAAEVASAAGRPLEVVDLGCGNAYLTLGTYEYLHGVRSLDVRVTGVDVKAQARAHGEQVTAELGWSEAVRFVEGTVLAAPVDGADIVLALHACDTATDEALARAVRWQAPVVLASPCCHHDVQRQLGEAAQPPPAPYAGLVRHGILRERFADVLTDALRAALLRLHGYRVEVIEFVGSEHTPRNTLIRAVRTGAAPTLEQVEDYRALTAAWSVTPKLETLLAP